MERKHVVKIISFGLIISLVVLGSVFQVGAQQKKEAYKIGCNYEITGPFANVIATLKMGLITEVDDINAKGGINGHPLELIFEDNGMDVTKGANILMKFARDKDIKVVLGPLWSGFGVTLLPIAEREKILTFCNYAPARKEREAKPRWVFWVPENDIPMTKRIVELAKANGYKKVLVFHDGDPIWDGWVTQNLFIPMAKEVGIEAADSGETFSAQDKDMTPQILKFKDRVKDYDALWLATNGLLAATVMKNLRDQGIGIPVMGTSGYGWEFTLKLGKEAVEGVQFPGHRRLVINQLDASDPFKPVISSFMERMKARWNGNEGDIISCHGHDQIRLLYDIFKSAGENPTRAQLRDALEVKKGFQGACRTYNFKPDDHNGVIKSSLTFIKIENNKFVLNKLPGY